MPIEENQLVDAQTMTKPLAEKHVVEADEVASATEPTHRQAGHLVDELRCELLVGVEKEDEIVAEWQIVEAPLLLLRVAAVPYELHHRRAGRACDLLRAVVAP